MCLFIDVISLEKLEYLFFNRFLGKGAIVLKQPKFETTINAYPIFVTLVIDIVQGRNFVLKAMTSYREFFIINFIDSTSSISSY